MRIKLLVILFAAGLVPALLASDWTESRGPSRDGTSSEKNLPSRWSPAGENLAWTLPFGGRSTPAIFGNRLHVATTNPEQAQVMVREALEARQISIRRLAQVSPTLEDAFIAMISRVRGV
jgi:hypothetical protein